MIQKRKSIAYIGMLMAALIIMPNAWSQEDSPEKKEWLEKMEAKRQALFEELNLTDEQKTLLEDNKNKNREQMKSIMQTMREKRSELRQELQKEELDMSRINQIQSEIKSSQAQMVDFKLQGILEVRKILKPEQFNKFLNSMKDGYGQFHHSWGNKGEKQ